MAKLGSISVDRDGARRVKDRKDTSLRHGFLEGLEGGFLRQRPDERVFSLQELSQRDCDLDEIADKTTVVVDQAKERMDVIHTALGGSFGDSDSMADMVSALDVRDETDGDNGVDTSTGDDD
ncbi:hypothetical protein BGZ96_007951 [Linnemannia gamsii]|uniref:Uncharacterized protein n=1 Tax=Linnemannia gamsii TaxID=64522 RepID=A0ABQ7K1M0_9FUNG|nr:hypothetical protein BGZ96_007951 [Linnemannia gamsii]